MTQRTRISQLFLRLFVTFLSFEAGAGLYETRVLIPLWSASPPETVRNWDSTLTSRSRQRFWKLIHPALILSAVATLATGWQTPRKHRRWLLVSTVFSLIVEVASLTYFVPTLVKLLIERGEGLTDEEISTKTKTWVKLNGIRAVLGTAGFLAALRALSTPPSGD